ncbi:MAG: DUF4079 domain-containing protein [Limnospira sp.]
MDVRALLEPIADFFAGFNLPEPVIEWGHPMMMGIVIFVMGSFVGYTGWRGRLATDKEAAIASRSGHRKLAPWMFLFMALGFTGGVLSLVMQGEPIFESPHFWTGTAVLGLLGVNGAISLSQFGGDRQGWRMAHAYIGSVALLLMVVHTVFGLKLGLSI